APFLSILRSPPCSPLFPYTTLFRSIVGENAYTGGKAWVYPYYDQQGKLAFTHFPAYEVLPFWADNEHTDLDCAVRLYPVTVYDRSEEHTSELQSRFDLVCRLLLETK